MQESRGCFYPLNAIAIHPQGDEKFCLVSGYRGDLLSEDFKNQCKSLNQEIIKGELPESCRSCKSKEQRGLQSRRLKAWQRKSQMYGQEFLNKMIHEQAEPTLRHLEISFSNICNLNCAMCSSEFSSSWIQADRKAVEDGLEFRNFTSKYQKIQRLPQQKIDELLRRAENLDLVIIKGGEPTRDPQCLEFMEKLSHVLAQKRLTVFLQTNGTRHPQEWLPSLNPNFNLEVGFSLDGYGSTYEWIRGVPFEPVLQHFHYLDKSTQVKSLSLDFTLSLFNVLHLPEFLRQVLTLKSEMTKLTICPFFQWAQESYARVDNLNLDVREKIVEEIKPILSQAPQFFQNTATIIDVLKQPRTSEQSQRDAQRWVEYMNGLRKVSLYELQPSLQNALL